MLGVIGIVVDGGQRAQLVVAVGQHTLRVHVGETERTHHLGHALAPSVVLYGLEQGC